MNMIQRTSRVLIWLAVFGCLLGSIAVMQNRITREKDASWYRQSMAFLPQSDRIAPYLMGFQTTYAAFLWIKTTLYFGSEYMGPRQFSWLIAMIDMVTRLNPRFFPAYEFAALFLPDYCKNPDAARTILDRGISNVGQRRWKLLFYRGWIEYRYQHDYLRAAEYLGRAAREKGVPPYIAGLAATFYQNAGMKNMGRIYLQSLYLSAEDPKVKRYVEKELKKFDTAGVAR